MALLSGSKPYVDFFHPQPPLTSSVGSDRLPVRKPRFHGAAAYVRRHGGRGSRTGICHPASIDVERRIAIACSALLAAATAFSMQRRGAQLRAAGIAPAAGMLLPSSLCAHGCRLGSLGAVALLLASRDQRQDFLRMSARRRSVRASVDSCAGDFRSLGCSFFRGALAGLAPCLLAWSAAPVAFVYGVFTYGMTAPIECTGHRYNGNSAGGRNWEEGLDRSRVGTWLWWRSR